VNKSVQPNIKTLIEKHRNTVIRAAVIIILVIAGYLRLGHISGYMTFLGDEGRDALIVKRMIVDHAFTLLGPTASVGGFFLGPIYYYFMLPFLWAWKLDPSGPAVMVALFGIATAYLVYLLGRDLYSRSVGVIAASIYAVSPLVIAYSRSSWNPNIVPFFSTLLILFLWRAVAHKRLREMFWAGVVLGIGLQLHYLFLFLVGVTGAWMMLTGTKRTAVRGILLAVGGLIVGLSPYLAFELRHGFVNTQTVIRFIGEGKETGFLLQRFINVVTDIPFRVFGRLIYRLPQPEILQNLTDWTASFYRWIVPGAAVASVLLLASFALRAEPKRPRLASLLLLLWFLIPVALFGLYKKPIYDYYFGIFFAAPFLISGRVLALMSTVRYGAVIAGILWVSLLVFNWQGRPFLYPPNNQLANTRRVSLAVLDTTGGKPFNFALITDSNSDHAYRYFFEIWGRKPMVIENETNDPDRSTVTDQLIVLCENPECRPLGHSLWEIAGFGRAEIVGSWDVGFVKIFRLVHYEPGNGETK
jgi:4-amino-4-deoxy-L-arabinose transferase-like glycosyltransferase